MDKKHLRLPVPTIKTGEVLKCFYFVCNIFIRCKSREKLSIYHTNLFSVFDHSISNISLTLNLLLNFIGLYTIYSISLLNSSVTLIDFFK